MHQAPKKLVDFLRYFQPGLEVQRMPWLVPAYFSLESYQLLAWSAQWSQFISTNTWIDDYSFSSSYDESNNRVYILTNPPKNIPFCIQRYTLSQKELETHSTAPSATTASWFGLWLVVILAIAAADAACSTSLFTWRNSTKGSTAPVAT